jgi:hypothetical protein
MTGLSALNPFFLSLLPLAVLPIVFHLFFRLKKQLRPFPTLMFFHRIDPNLNARRRLREWLVLLLRTLLILLVLLALARPVWFGIGKEGTVAVVLVLDNSGSMSGMGDNGRSKLKDAVDAARGVVAQLHEKDSAGIVLFADDPAAALPAGLTSDKSALRNALNHISETEASGSVAAALERAAAMLEHSQATHFEIHVLSDLHAPKWSQPPVNLRAPRARASLIVHRLPSHPPKFNVSMAGAQVNAKSILSGRRLPVDVQLAGTTAIEGRVRLNWLDDSGNRGSEEITVPPQQEKTVTVTLESQNPGFRWAGFQVEGDDFDADNRAYVGFVCLEKRSVLFTGNAPDFGDLPLAISPEGEGKLSGLIPAFDTAGWTDSLRDNTAQFVVATWDSVAPADAQAQWTALRRFLDAGGNALLVPGAGGFANRHLPDWLTVAPGSLQASSNGLALVVLDRTHPMFNDLHDAKGEVALRNIKVFRFCPLRVSPDDTPVLGLEDGRVLLAEQKIGRGRLLASGFAFDSRWSTLPLKPGFIALAQNMALAGTGAATNIVAMVAGDPLRLGLPDATDIQVQSLGGSPLDWKGKSDQLLSLPRSGVYAVRHGNDTSYLTVRSSDKEGQQKFLAGDSLPAMGKLAYAVKDFTGGEALVSEFRRLEKSFDFSPWLLLLAFAALLAEGWLANPPPIKAKFPVAVSLASKTPFPENATVR